MSAGPGVPLGGNYSARRGSISASSCFLSPSLWPLALSQETATGLLPHSAYECVRVSVGAVMHSCMYVCSPMLSQVLFLACFTHDWLHLRVCWCVSVYLSVCLRSVPLCVLPLAHLTPHLLVSSQQAFHWAVTQCATVLSLKRAGLRG